MSTIVLTHQEWDKIKVRIDADYGRTMRMISWKLKRELGFTVRDYRAFDAVTSSYTQDIRLDFYDDQHEVIFRLKYL